jgi:hypothetical protein
MISVELKGKLEPVHLDGDMTEVMKAMNLAMANGGTLFAQEDANGEPVVFNMREILTMSEVDGIENAFSA